MRKIKLSTGEVRAYEKMADYWDKHNLTEIWDKTKDVDVEVNIKSEVTLFEIERTLSERLQKEAIKRGVSSGTLANLWLQQRLNEESTPRRMKTPRRTQVA